MLSCTGAFRFFSMHWLVCSMTITSVHPFGHDKRLCFTFVWTVMPPFSIRLSKRFSTHAHASPTNPIRFNTSDFSSLWSFTWPVIACRKNVVSELSEPMLDSKATSRSSKVYNNYNMHIKWCISIYRYDKAWRLDMANHILRKHRTKNNAKLLYGMVLTYLKCVITVVTYELNRARLKSGSSTFYHD